MSYPWQGYALAFIAVAGWRWTKTHRTYRDEWVDVAVQAKRLGCWDWTNKGRQ